MKNYKNENSILQYKPIFNPKALTGILKITLYNHDKTDKFSCLGMLSNIDSDLGGITIRVIDNFEQFEDNTKDYICYDSIDNKSKTYKIWATEINNESVEIKRIYSTKIKELYKDEEIKALKTNHMDKETLDQLLLNIEWKFENGYNIYDLKQQISCENKVYLSRKLKENYPEVCFSFDGLEIYQNYETKNNVE